MLTTMPRKYPQSTWMNLLASAKNFFWNRTTIRLSQTPLSASKQNRAPFHTRFTPRVLCFSQRSNPTFHPHCRVAQPVDRVGCLLSISVVISTSRSWPCARLVHNSICQGLGRSVIPLVHKPITITFSSFKKFIFIVSCGQPFWMLSQADTPDCVWTQFEHANGTLASEGCMVDGVPAVSYTHLRAHET